MSGTGQSSLFAAVDCGSGSVRAAIFTADGEKLGWASRPIQTRNTAADYYEQSTNDIWPAVCASIREACTATGLDDAAAQVTALAFDATCSLVVVDREEHVPLSVAADDTLGDTLVWNIILWMDHRAVEQAERINANDEPAVARVLKHFGNRISPENEPPKLLWVKEHAQDTYARGLFFDLADWLTFKCTDNVAARSSCTVACKWGWGSGDCAGWSPAFFEAIGLSELSARDFESIGNDIRRPGEPLGMLSDAAAKALGLSSNCVVSAPMIDAHAGALASLGANAAHVLSEEHDSNHRLAMICGTSTCHLAVSPNQLFIDGVWGPFRDAIVPGMFVTEGLFVIQTF